MADQQMLNQRCPLCAHNEARFFSRKISFGFPIQYLICQNCGFVFQDASESQAADPQFYAETYRKIYQSTEAPTAKDLRQQTLRAENQVEYLRKLDVFDPKRVLDFGASSGLLLEKLHEAFGCEVMGVEPGRAYRERAEARGIPMAASLDALMSGNPGRFNLVTMMHVLEHLQNPLETMDTIREKLLLPNGYILVEVPNLYAHDSFELAHLSCFTTHTLTQMLLMAGFSLISVRKYGLPRSETLDLYVEALAINSNCQVMPEHVEPERGVAAKRRAGLLKRQLLTRLNPGKTWLPLED